MKDFSKRPKNLGIYAVNVSELFSYTYLPIKLPKQTIPVFERRLSPFERIIGRACSDYIGDFGLDVYVDSYMYVTAKHLYQKQEQGFNRPGWHSDGFGTDDISYIWSNTQPTIFNSGPFNLSPDENVSMAQMEDQALPANDYFFWNNALLRLDQYSIHRVGEIQTGNRAFVKICFSKDIYNLKGNAINHQLDYNWEYVDRLLSRNVPQTIKA